MESKVPTDMQAGPASIIIVDDHYLIRSGLRSMLANEPGLEIVGEASNGREALTLCHKLHPDLVMMDVRMPEMDGLEATREIKKHCPSTSVIMVTMHESQDYLFEALKAGACGYVLKEATQAELTTAIRKALYGDLPLNRSLATQLLQRLVREAHTRENLDKAGADTGPQEVKQPASHIPLTRRESEILSYMITGRTNREIAQSMALSSGTIKTHVQHIINKLGVSDRTQAAVRAIELGLIPSAHSY